MSLFRKIKTAIKDSSDASQSWFFWVGVIFAISSIIFLKNVAIFTQHELLFYSADIFNTSLELWRTICFIISITLIIISIIMAIYVYSITHKPEVLFNTIGKIIIGIAIVVTLELFYTSHTTQINEMFVN